MSWVTILWAMMAAFAATLAGIYFVAWVLAPRNVTYLVFVVMAGSAVGLAGTELWMMKAQTPQEFGEALRWFHVPIWSGFCCFAVLVHLRLRPRFLWVGWLAVGLRTASLVPNFGSAPNLNYTALTGISHVSVLGEPVALVTGDPNPWMLIGQASQLLALLFVIDGSISTLRRGESGRALLLVFSLLALVGLGTAQAVLVFWEFVDMPMLITPLFLLTAGAMAYELSIGLLRAERAERDVQIKDVALDLSEQRLSLAAEAAGAGFWSLEPQSGAAWATSKTRELFGLPPGGDLHLADFLERVHQPDRARLKRLIEEALRSNDSYRAEFRVVGPVGRIRWLAGLGRGVGRSNGGATTLMGVSMDITVRKAMQDKLRRQRAWLERTSRMETMSELSAFLAHELNQPLAMILTNAEAAQALLAQSPTDLSEVTEILADIVTADRRAADVIRHLRGLLDRGEPQREELVLDDAIRRVLRLLGNEVDDQEVTVDLSLASDLPYVKVDRILIEQVLLNLLNNACEAVAGNPAGERRVSIVTRAHGDSILVEVKDNGCGIPDPDRIFDAFYSTKPGGLGMGLAIVRSIVQSHGGHVWAEPAPVRGTTVSLTLPTDGAES